MTEAILTKRIIEALKKVPETWAFKIHGGRYQAGVADVICCHKGRFFALEVKLPGKERNLTPLQQRFLLHIDGAKGTATMVTSVKQALEVIHGNSH